MTQRTGLSADGRAGPAGAAELLRRGRRLFARGRHDEALESLSAAIRLDETLTAAHVCLAEVLAARGAFDEALSHFRRVLQLKPDHLPTHLNVGCVFQRCGFLDEAAACFRTALRIDPDLPEAHRNLGVVLCEQHRVDEALASYDRALRRRPDWAEVRLYRALALLSGGRFAEGWDDYEYRRARPGNWAPLPVPRWHHPHDQHGNVLVFNEQGVGTETMFASCLPDLIAAVDHCVIRCEPRLARLFARSFPKATTIGDGRPASPIRQRIDAQIPIGSLPRYFRRLESDFPRRSQYLVADPRQRAKWRARLAGLGPGMKVGISWRGGSTTEKIVQRSASLPRWRPLISVGGVHWINIQYGRSQDMLDKFHGECGLTVHDWNDLDQRDDLDDLAALLAELDLVVSVSNSTVHLAAALGTPVWTLLPYAADWRWMHDRADSPWHPSVCLFRQPQPGEWTSVFQQAREELLSMTAELGRRVA